VLVAGTLVAAGLFASAGGSGTTTPGRDAPAVASASTAPSAPDQPAGPVATASPATPLAGPISTAGESPVAPTYPAAPAPRGPAPATYRAARPTATAPRPEPPTSPGTTSTTRIPAPTGDGGVGAACAVRLPGSGRVVEIDRARTDLTCEQARRVLETYLAMPLDDAHGNANVREVLGWTCAMPTAAAAQQSDTSVRCESEGLRITVRR